MTTQTFGMPPTPEEAEATARGHRLPVIETAVNGLVISSEQIAIGAGVEHRAVLQMISKHQARVERFVQVAFEMRAGYNNAQVRVALLNEQQATLLMSFMRNTEQVIDFKVNMVDAFFAMADQLNNMPALTDDQIVAQALQITAAKVQALETKIEADAPKVGYVDTFVADSDNLSFKTVASTCRVNEGKLREFLIACEWIFLEKSERWSDSKGEKETVRRYTEYSHKKMYFIQRQEHKAPRFRGEVMHYLKITPAGSEAISRLVGKAIDKHGDFDSAVEAAQAKRQERIARRRAHEQKAEAQLW